MSAGVRLRRARYRLGQGLRALYPRLSDADVAFAHERLSAAQARLFDAMEKRDRGHAVRVARRLLAGGRDEPDLLVAALLHDCAKGRVAVWLRACRVLAPGVLRRLAVEGGGGARAAAYRLLCDGRLSAELAAKAGASPAAVRLIGGRPGTADAAAFAALTAADDCA